MQSKKFHWKTYEAPRWPSEALEHGTEEKEDPSTPRTFNIRHMKQGATGAVKTWPAAEVLLDYLIHRGGMRDVCDKMPDNSDNGVLDLTSPPSPLENLESRRYSSPEELKNYNIVELGGGTGYLSVGLALALTSIGSDGSSLQPRVRLMCTDNDRTTIKNMRHNISSQNMNKIVRVEPLGWGADIGGENFAKALRLQFQEKINESSLFSNQEPEQEEEDPIHLLSHIVASDVHYGVTTLEPLSAIISAAKLRNPRVAVTLLLKERSPNAAADLKSQIEQKVRCVQLCSKDLQGFTVRVRDVIHEDLQNMKMVEC